VCHKDSFAYFLTKISNLHLTAKNNRLKTPKTNRRRLLLLKMNAGSGSLNFRGKTARRLQPPLLTII